jgi:hypothetical protein
MGMMDLFFFLFLPLQLSHIDWPMSPIFSVTLGHPQQKHPFCPGPLPKIEA